MWRSLFLAIGIMSIVMGIECLMIDSAALHAANAPSNPSYLSVAATAEPTTRTFRPTEWQPWSLIGAGALTVLYAITLRRAGAPE